MILRVERVDRAFEGGMTVIVEELPKVGDVLQFDGNSFSVINVISFTAHTTVLVKEVNVFKILHGVDDEQKEQGETGN